MIVKRNVDFLDSTDLHERADAPEVCCRHVHTGCVVQFRFRHNLRICSSQLHTRRIQQL